KAFRRFELILDSVEPRSDGSCQCQIGIAVGSRNAAFDAQARSTTYNPETGGTVVVTPGEPGRGPGAVYITLVGVDRRGIKWHYLRRMGNPSAQEPAEIIRNPFDRPQFFISHENIFSVLPQAQ